MYVFDNANARVRLAMTLQTRAKGVYSSVLHVTEGEREGEHPV